MLSQIIRRSLSCNRFSLFTRSVNKDIMSKHMKRKSAIDTDSKSKKPYVRHWANALTVAMEDPNLQIYTDERIVVIKDTYPKALHHFLVLPREKISNLSEVNSSHLDLLQYMHKVGEGIIKQKQYDTKTFRMGYHSVPSMLHLHMHIISDDFCSDSLKTKKHYNSFVTDFFIESGKIIECLKTSGKVVIPSEAKCKEFLSQPLVCYKCNEKFDNIPKLKKHFLSHLKEIMFEEL